MVGPSPPAATQVYWRQLRDYVSSRCDASRCGRRPMRRFDMHRAYPVQRVRRPTPVGRPRLARRGCEARMLASHRHRMRPMPGLFADVLEIGGAAGRGATMRGPGKRTSDILSALDLSSAQAVERCCHSLDELAQRQQHHHARSDQPSARLSSWAGATRGSDERDTPEMMLPTASLPRPRLSPGRRRGGGRACRIHGRRGGGGRGR
jgi:hypothetical protein